MDLSTSLVVLGDGGAVNDEYLDHQNNDDDELYMVFREFAMFGVGSAVDRYSAMPLMDSKQFQKLCRDCDLLTGRSGGKLTKADVDLVFIQCRCPGTNRIHFEDFVLCLEQIATKKAWPVEAVCDAVRSSAGPTLNAVTMPEAFSSPLRDTPEPLKRQLVARSSPAKAAASPTNTSLQRQQDVADDGEWYEVANPFPQGPDEMVYYVNSLTNETRWTKPTVMLLLENSSSSNNSKLRRQQQPYVSVFDKLTDPAMFTGTQRYRAEHGSPTKLELQRAFRGHTNSDSDDVLFSDAKFPVRY